MNREIIKKAKNLLIKTVDVIPEAYTEYDGGVLFLAYPPNCKNKEDQLSPFYLVDLKHNLAGPFSPAFDFDGFFKSVKNLKKL